MELAPRPNLIAGDNGLSKSFLLDVAWWALTRRWPQEMNGRLSSVYPAWLGYVVESKPGEVEFESPYALRDQAWIGRSGRPWDPGLLLYALADGCSAEWDASRTLMSAWFDLDAEK